jgi:hypothetical protein
MTEHEVKHRLLARAGTACVVSRDVGLEIPRPALVSMDVQIGALTPAREEQLSSWTHAT